MSDSYYGVARGYGGNVSAEITTDGEKLTSVRLTGAYETADIGGRILPLLEQRFLEAGSYEVDAISGATLTWSGARYALRDAMQQAGLLRQESRNAREEYTTELLVIGCGPSGISAAMSAGDLGTEVLMVDATETFGGNGLWAQGGYFVETEEQKAAGVNFTVKEAYEAGLYWANYLNDPLIMRKWLGECGETFRWANEHGAGLHLLPYQKMIAHEGKPLCFHSWNGNDPIGHFRSYIDNMDNVTVMLGTKCTSLLQKEDGTVIGAKARKLDGTDVTIHAKAVVIGCGGYIGNEEMVREAVGEDLYRYLITDTTIYNDGSGLQMAWAAGGGKRGTHLLETHGGRTGLGKGMDGLPGCDLLMNLPILWVNKNGRRFMNEETIYESLFYSNILQSQGGRAFIVFDRASVEQWMSDTIPMRMHFWDRFGKDGGYYCPAVPGFDEDFAVAQAGGMGFTGNTIEELAQAMGAAPAVLCATVERYNDAVRSGNDPEFFKTAENLKYTVERGPFYALQCNLQAQCTVGGIRINDEMQVVDEDDNPIPGLYAGGSDAGGLFAQSYSVLAGVCISWALTSGRLEGRNAADYIRSL